MFESVLAAIRAAQLELKRKNVDGRVVIELDRANWRHFIYGLTVENYFHRSDVFGQPEDTVLLHGGVVRRIDP